MQKYITVTSFPDHMHSMNKTNVGIFFTFNHSCEMFINNILSARLNAWARGAVS
jgi:hypothetical protein